MQDVDHDGVPEILVPPLFSSSIRIYSGATATFLREIVGQPGSFFGLSIDDAGDFNGDGVPDFVAGAPGYISPTVFWGGAVHVHNGRDGGEVARIEGHFGNQQLGLWVAGLGDINGDGYDDVAACGFYRRVWIYGGPDGHKIRHHDGELTRPSVAGIGDVDGDGRPDYVCGWPQDSTTGLWTGKAVVYSGRTGEEIHTVFGDTPHGGGDSGDHLGWSVAGVGDVNADGVPDFAAGAPGEIDVTFPASHGLVRVYSGVDASVIWEWTAVEHTHSGGTHFGRRIAGDGDVNGDGHADVLVAAPLDGLEQGANVSAGSVSVFSGRTGEQLWRVFDAEIAFRSEHLAMFGDLNGDGLADFARGNERVDGEIDLTGRVTIYAGARGDVDRLCPASANSTGASTLLETHGPIGIANNWLTLAAIGAVPGQTALLFYGPEAAPLPFGAGSLCIGPPFVRIPPALVVESDGSVERMLDLHLQPFHQGQGRVVPGATWTFQLWYRDPAAGGAAFNLSDALRIEFLP